MTQNEESVVFFTDEEIQPYYDTVDIICDTFMELINQPQTREYIMGKLKQSGLNVEFGKFDWSNFIDVSKGVEEHLRVGGVTINGEVFYEPNKERIEIMEKYEKMLRD